MDQITRFEFIETCGGSIHRPPEGELLEDPDGDYVLYEDHQRIVAALQRQLAAALAGTTFASQPEDDDLPHRVAFDQYVKRMERLSQRDIEHELALAHRAEHDHD